MLIPPHFFSFVLFAGEGKAVQSDTSVIIFIAQLVLMLVIGRLLGELLLRIRQPEVLGQLVAGILIGPTVLGNVWPGAHHLIFPDTPELKKMIDGVSQVGVLMLLLLAGMETNFAIVKRKKRTALLSSISGIVVPFACGLLLGELLPDSMLPAPEKRLMTALFVATALSISSIKIVAMVLMEVDFMRRNLGQLILATAIIDDTIGWIIVAVISGIAAEGVLNLKDVGLAIGGTAIFLTLSFTVGRTLVTHIIRWTNDTLHIEFSVLSVILVLMFLMAVATDLIGVHTVLGAFIMGVLAGQSPMMTDHIREQLRGVVLGLFAPVFFAVAGLNVDLTILRDLHTLELALALILIASFGKFAGCFVGGKFGGLTAREAFAMAVGMNARGTTEVIVATIGLSIGVLTKEFYTLIVVMAISTTMVMPPMLRWALGRIPTSEDEKERLTRKEAEAADFVPHVERLLIAADEGECVKLAALLGGLFVGGRRIMATVLDLEPSIKEKSGVSNQSKQIEESVRMAIKLAVQLDSKSAKKDNDEEAPATPPAQLTALNSAEEPSLAILKEIKNGYDMLFVGLEDALTPDSKNKGTIRSSIEQIIREFKGPLAIAVARTESELALRVNSMNILVPTTGTKYSRLAAEVAIAIAKACSCGITALNVAPPPEGAFFARRVEEHLKPARAVLSDIKALGQREGVAVRAMAEVRRTAEPAILSQIKKGKHNLVVLGANVRPGEGLFFGHSVVVLLQKANCSLLIVSS
ncbi:MAG TPA: cation:proton antiporter [Pyrinomonadaceae bacterium]|jgi:Kef-type K+ transport system membrane component KefB/nucleotide-binding universal stress UspA family protein